MSTQGPPAPAPPPTLPGLPGQGQHHLRGHGGRGRQDQQGLPEEHELPQRLHVGQHRLEAPGAGGRGAGAGWGQLLQPPPPRWARVPPPSGRQLEDAQGRPPPRSPHPLQGRPRQNRSKAQLPCRLTQRRAASGRSVSPTQPPPPTLPSRTVLPTVPISSGCRQQARVSRLYNSSSWNWPGLSARRAVPGAALPCPARACGLARGLCRQGAAAVALT